MGRSDDCYAALPTKRVGAGMLFRDVDNRVLLVEPVYKRDWEVPGGLVEVDESPRAAAEREIHEELGIERPPGRLLCLDWHRAEPPATEGLMVLFDGGELTDVEMKTIRLPPGELRSWAFLSLEEAAVRLSPRLYRRVAACLAHPGETLYLENGSSISAADRR